QARAEAERVHVSAARDAIARVDLFRAHRELTMAVQVLEQAQASARSFFGRLRGAEARAEAAQVAVDRVRSRIEAQTSALAHAAQDAASAEAALHAMSDGPTPPDPVDTLGVRQHILAALGLSCAPQDVQDVVMGCVVGVVCPAGAFELGSPAAEEGRGREETQHRMTPTRSYAMGTYPVVQALWKAVMGANLSMARVREPTRPVEWVTWHDCVAFCERLNALLGLPAATRGEHRIAASHGFRLPTEAEWEYAARAGQQTHHRHPREPKQAWFKSDDRSRFEPPPPVGQKRPNAWGLYDMSGNVWEWTSDIYGDYPAGAATDPLGASDGTFRVVRGGSWNRTAGDARGGFRRGPVPDERYFDVGLRLCRTIP
ncbi:MAG: hypothetical protein RLZZ299_2905, partial [Pseudomonadota bacterium]